MNTRPSLAARDTGNRSFRYRLAGLSKMDRGAP